PLNHPDWIFEIKHDGFRALAHVEGGECQLVSRNGNAFRTFSELSAWIGERLRVTNAILDGEIVALDSDGRSCFNDLMFRRGDLYFYAFDLLWHDGEDLRELPLIERKARLKELMPRRPSRLLYVDHIEQRGTDFFNQVCVLDLEGI